MKHSQAARLKPYLASLFLVMLSSSAAASVINLSAELDCTKANAGIGTCSGGGSGSGTALLQYDTTSRDLSWNVEWSGLSGSLTVAHFHGPANASQNAGVQVNFLDLGGSLNPSIGTTMLDAAQEVDLLSGLWYVNVHSTAFPAGEIRGQITQTAVSEPITLTLLGLGLAGAGIQRRRQRKTA
ncbi:MAG: CHRD domain-containing protein [Gammaproteobacteria bacterium]|nr:CHRD domain-containing protein [Gammaproteobacteria bacterium]